MTLTIDLSPETESRLSKRVSELGTPLRDFVMDLIDDAARQDTVDGAAIIDHLREIGVVGAI